MTIKTKRTHDILYLKENRYEKTKEMFKFIFNHAFPSVKASSYEHLKILDIGCAAGEFTYYLKKKIKGNSNIIGADIHSNLLRKAKQNVKDVKFIKKNVLHKNAFQNKKFNKIFMIGVHPIFDSFEKCFTNLINWTTSGGEIYICDMFNPYPVDVIIRYKLSKNYKKKSYETGWNIFSKNSVISFLKQKKRIKSLKFKQFHMPFDLKMNKLDTVRSWTFKDQKGQRIMTNGLSIIQNQTLLKIKLK